MVVLFIHWIFFSSRKMGKLENFSKSHLALILVSKMFSSTPYGGCYLASTGAKQTKGADCFRAKQSKARQSRRAVSGSTGSAWQARRYWLPERRTNGPSHSPFSPEIDTFGASPHTQVTFHVRVAIGLYCGSGDIRSACLCRRLLDLGTFLSDNRRIASVSVSVTCTRTRTCTVCCILYLSVPACLPACLLHTVLPT